MAEITSIPGIGERTAEMLIRHGFTSVAEIAEATVETLMTVPGFGAIRAAAIIQTAAGMVGQKRKVTSAANKNKTKTKTKTKKEKKNGKTKNKKQKQGKKEKKQSTGKKKKKAAKSRKKSKKKTKKSKKAKKKKK